MVMELGSYFISKTKIKRTDVYFNGKPSDGRMGGLYPIKIFVYDTDLNTDLYLFWINHLVVDDESSNCIPFVSPGKNWQVQIFI